MGAVYEVEHEHLGVHYAMKTFTLEEGHVELFRKRFRTEGKILARLNHPNLVRVIDLDIDENIGALYFIMDLVLFEDGETHTLADIEPGGADEEQILEWFRQMCDALAYVHSNGIVHRDIKLNNILLAPDRRVVLSDFGISKVSDEKMRSDVDVTKTMVTGMTTGQHLVMGTSGYIAPEVQRGCEATSVSDVYSLGVAFFRLLTNIWYDPCLAPQKDSDSLVSMNSVKLLEPFKYRWAAVLPRMLDEDPAERPTNLSELVGQLRSATGPKQKKADEPKAHPRRKRRVLFAIAGAVAVVVAAVGYFVFVSRSAPPVIDDFDEVSVFAAFTRGFGNESVPPDFHDIASEAGCRSGRNGIRRRKIIFSREICSCCAYSVSERNKRS